MKHNVVETMHGMGFRNEEFSPRINETNDIVISLEQWEIRVHGLDWK